MNRLKKTVFLIAVICGLLLSASGQDAAVRIIQTTDLHGTIDHGRLARVATLVERETRDAGGKENSLRIDCGDLVQGSYAMTFPAGREFMIRFLNRLSFDVFIPGNHDFEFGSAALLPLLGQFRGTVLASNLEWTGAPVRPWKMFRRSGLNIAVIGIAYPSLDRMFVPPVLDPVRVLSVKKQLETVIPEVMSARPDLILLAVHAGEQTRFEPDFSCYDLVRRYPQIDLVLCGHSHQTDPGKALGKSTWRIQGPALANGIAVAEISFDRKKRRVTSLKTRLAMIQDAPEHPEIKNQVKSLDRQAFRSGRQPVAEIPSELRPPERNEYSSFLTKVCGRAIMKATKAEIVFYGVSSRFRVQRGVLNRFQLFRLLPYADHILTVDLTADEVIRILQEQIAIRQKKGMYQTPSGLHFTLAGRKVRSVALDPSGQPLENGRTYRTAFSSYIFAGSGRSPILHSIVKNKEAVYFPAQVREMVADYLTETCPIQKKQQRGTP